MTPTPEELAFLNLLHKGTHITTNVHQVSPKDFDAIPETEHILLVGDEKRPQPVKTVTIGLVTVSLFLDHAESARRAAAQETPAA